MGSTDKEMFWDLEKFRLGSADKEMGRTDKEIISLHSHIFGPKIFFFDFSEREDGLGNNFGIFKNS